MKKNLMPLLGVAFVAALVATGFFYGLLIPRLRGGGETMDARSAVVAKRALNRGALLSLEDVERAAIDPSEMPKNPALSVDSVVGLTLLEPAGPGQPITLPMLTRRGESGGATLAIPSGMRAVTIHPASSGGVLAMLTAGGRVDIQVLDRASSQIRLRRMMENVEVLSVNPGKSDVTLLVNPADADRLSLADAAMNIRIVLRNPADKATSGPQVIESAAISSSQAKTGPQSPQAELLAAR